MIEYLHQIDYAIFSFINQKISNPFFDALMPFLRNAKSWIPLYLFLVLFLINKYKLESIKYAIYIVIAFALADYISYEFLKPWFARLRPCHSTTLQVRLLLGHCGGKWSFPSSHASNHMAIALSIVLANIFHKKWIKFAWIIWALAIGFAQIYVGVHYPSDILGGFVLGILIAYFNFYIVLPFLNKLFVLFHAKNAK